MTIKQNGGVFGRNPTFNDVTIEGQLTFDGDIDINSDLKVDGDLDVIGTSPTLTLRDSRTGATWSAGTALGKLDFYTSDTSGIGAHSIASIGVVAGGTNTASPDGELVFSTGAYNTAAAERMRIDSSGSIGIGTDSPNGLLETNSTGDNFTYLRSGDANTVGIFFGNQSDSATASIQMLHSDNSLSIRGYNNTEAMRIDSSGQVGIGTDSPGRLVDLKEPDNNDGARLRLRSATSIDNYPTIGSVEFYSDDISGSSSGIVGSIDVEGIGTWNGASNNAAMTFNLIQGLAGTTSPVEAMRIDSRGNLLVGGTSTPTSSIGNIVLTNGAAPTASASDSIVLYAEDVSSSSELKVRDEAGNVTTLSPHNFALIPEGPSEDMAWSYYSERDGKRINVDMLKAIRVLERLSGEQLVFQN